MIDLSYRPDLPSKTGAIRRTNVQATWSQSRFVLGEACEILDITPHVLARLIGYGPTNVYAWFEQVKSPSQAYWVRIAHIQNLRLRGINLKRIRTLDWSKEPFRIEWWPGAEPHKGEAGYDPKYATGDDAGDSTRRDVRQATD